MKATTNLQDTIVNRIVEAKIKSIVNLYIQKLDEINFPIVKRSERIASFKQEVENVFNTARKNPNFSITLLHYDLSNYEINEDILNAFKFN